MHKIGESTSHVRFNAKTNGLQITQEKLREGIKLSSLLKIPAFFVWSNGMVTGIFLEQKLLLTKS